MTKFWVLVAAGPIWGGAFCLSVLASHALFAPHSPGIAILLEFITLMPGLLLATAQPVLAIWHLVKRRWLLAFASLVALGVWLALFGIAAKMAPAMLYAT